MSFSKAKIQRFNDIKPCAPSPAAYGTIKDKLKYCVTSHSERNVEPRSPSVSETGSAQSVPCRFRTPTLPKKMKTTTSVPKSKALFADNTDSEVLKEKIVECENKDAFIKCLTEEIEELKDKICNLNQQQTQLDMQNRNMELHVSNLKTEHENKIKSLVKNFEEDIDRVTEEKVKVKGEITLVKRQYEEIKEANKKDMIELKNNCDKFSELYNKSVEECKKLIEEKNMLLISKECELAALENNNTELQRKHSLQIERLQKEHQIEIQDIEFEILKTMTELQKEKEQASSRIKQIESVMNQAIADLRSEFEKEKDLLLAQYENKIKEAIEQAQVAHESETKEKLEELENNWKKKLEIQQRQSEAILQECQTISEYNIIQCEIEKKEVETKLLEKTKELEANMLQYTEIVTKYEELKEDYSKLQSDFSGSMSQLKQENDTINTALADTKTELKKYLEENRTYLITIKNFQNTIEVLKNRLISSDRDVEQLKVEVTENEKALLASENKCMQLASDLKQALDYNEELEMQHESAIKLNTSEIQQIRAELLEKVESYRKEIDTLVKKLSESEQLKREIMQQYRETQDVIEKYKMEFECFDAINSQYEFEMEQSHNELEDYRMREMDWNNVKEKLEYNVRELSGLLDLKQDEVVDLKKQVAVLKDQCESYCQHAEYYKNKMTEHEAELHDTGKIHKKYIEQSGRYDELLQKFEQLEKENLGNKREILRLTKSSKEKDDYLEKYNEQREAYEALQRKYELVEKENSFNKKKGDDQHQWKERLYETEQEKDTLLGRIEYLEGELKEISEKYANLAGHHNNKQKIKHLVDLKTKNEELIQANIDLELKMRSQLKAMEKLKKENSDLKKFVRKSKLHPDDKENIGSPNRSLNSSRVESPFRERN